MCAKSRLPDWTRCKPGGGTAATVPMPAFFTASPHPDSMCLFVFMCVYMCAYVYAFVRV